MGDLRTGQQLLDDFEADDRLTVRRMMASRHESPALRRITAALADMCTRLEKRLSAVSATKETGVDAATGYLHPPDPACDAIVGNLRWPGPGRAIAEAEEGSEELGCASGLLLSPDSRRENLCCRTIPSPSPGPLTL